MSKTKNNKTISKKSSSKTKFDSTIFAVSFGPNKIKACSVNWNRFK